MILLHVIAAVIGIMAVVDIIYIFVMVLQDAKSSMDRYYRKKYGKDEK